MLYTTSSNIHTSTVPFSQCNAITSKRHIELSLFPPLLIEISVTIFIAAKHCNCASQCIKTQKYPEIGKFISCFRFTHFIFQKTLLSRNQRPKRRNVPWGPRKKKRTEATHRLLHIVRGDERVGRPRGGCGAPGDVGSRVGVLRHLRHRGGAL